MGLQGYGTQTRGGLDGRVIKVTNLNSDGPGSFKEAVKAKGPRLVVFEVGGVIDLEKEIVRVDDPYITIAGQTAPSPGITLIRGGMIIYAHDFVMQHIRFRLGDAGEKKGSGFESEVTTAHSSYNVVIDHCSVCWGVDENLSVSGRRFNPPEENSHDVTLSNNIISEALAYSIHEKNGNHSMGTLVHDNCQNVSIIRNLYAHNNERNPWYKSNATGIVLNNFIYDPGHWAIRLAYVPKEWEGHAEKPEPCRVSVIGNVMKPGPSTEGNLPLVGSNYSNGSAFLEGNINIGGPIDDGNVTLLEHRPCWIEGLEVLCESSVPDYVLWNAGARPKDRDSVDRRIVEQVLSGTGHWINSQDEVGGYPVLEESHRSLDVPDTDRQQWLDLYTKQVE